MKKVALSLLTAFLVAGSYIGTIGAQSSSSSAPGLMPRGSPALPGMYFAGDRDTGIFQLTGNQMSFGGAGSEILRLGGGILMRLGTGSSPSSGEIRFAVSGSNFPSIQLTSNGGGGGIIQARSGGSLGLFTHSGAVGSESYNERIRLQPDGTVSVNTTTDSAFQFDVNGSLAHNGTQAYWLKGTTTYTSGSGTYTVPSGVRALKVRMVGGGGGGGYARAITTTNAQALGGGGQSGHYVELWMTGLGASYSYAVGAAGSGGVGATSTAATAGGDTTFSTFTAKGGGAGGDATQNAAGVNVGTPGTGPAKAANVGAIVNVRGRIPPTAVSTNPYAAAGQGTWYSSPGAGSHLSGDTTLYLLGSVGGSLNGDAGEAPGGGGGGADAWRNAADLQMTGGAGATGIIIIEEYF